MRGSFTHNYYCHCHYHYHYYYQNHYHYHYHYLIIICKLSVLKSTLVYEFRNADLRSQCRSPRTLRVDALHSLATDEFRTQSYLLLPELDFFFDAWFVHLQQTPSCGLADLFLCKESDKTRDDNSLRISHKELD